MKIISLAHPLHPGIPRWPGDPVVAFEDVADIGTQGYCLRRVTFGEHSGTHVNTPRAFFRDGKSPVDYPAEHWLRPAVCITMDCDGQPDRLLTPTDILRWEEVHGTIPRACMVLLNTGWTLKWATGAAFLGLDASGIGHFPGFSPEAAEMLVRERGVAGLGIDTHGVDGGTDPAFRVNRIVLERDGIVLECLCLPDGLPATGIELFIGVLPIPGASGCPASVIVRYEEE